MRFTVDVGELAVILELDAEPAAVDLTRDGLGDHCLDAAVEGMLTPVDPIVRADNASLYSARSGLARMGGGGASDGQFFSGWIHDAGPQAGER